MQDGVREVVGKRIAKLPKCKKPIKGAISQCGRPKGHDGDCDWQPLNIDWYMEELKWRREIAHPNRRKQNKKQAQASSRPA